MESVQLYSEIKIDNVVEQVNNLVLTVDDECREMIDWHDHCDDITAQIDSAVMVKTADLRAELAKINKEAEALKKRVQEAKEGSTKAIEGYMVRTSAQKIQSSNSTAYFKSNKHTVKVTVSGKGKIHKDFLKSSPDTTKIKNHFLATKKIPKGVEIEVTENDPTLVFKTRGKTN